MQFYIEGSKNDPHHYIKGNESVIAVAASHSYEGKEEIVGSCLGEGEYMTYLIDKAVQVIMFNPMKCQEQVSYWKTKKIQSVIAGGGSTILFGGLALVAAPAAAAAFGISALGFALYSGQRAIEADSEVNQWGMSLLQQTIELRRAASDFEYAFSNNLKGSVVHADEIKKTWKKVLDLKVKSLPAILYDCDIYTFFFHNPLDKERRNYSELKLNPMLIEAYDKVENFYHAINPMIEERKRKINQAADVEILENRKEKENILQKYKQIYDAACKVVVLKKHEFNEKTLKIEEVEENLVAVNMEIPQETIKDFEGATSFLKRIYRDTIDPIIEKYEERKVKIFKFKEDLLQKAEEERKNSVLSTAKNLKILCNIYLENGNAGIEAIEVPAFSQLDGVYAEIPKIQMPSASEADFEKRLAEAIESEGRQKRT